MRSYSVLTVNGKITDDNFHYTESGMTELLQGLEYTILDNKALYVYKHKNE